MSDEKPYIFDEAIEESLPPDAIEYIQHRSSIYEQVKRRKRRVIGACAAFTAVIVGGSGVAVLRDASYDKPEAVETTLDTNPVTTLATTTVPIETTTSTTLARTCETPTMDLRSGETLFGIAQLCGIAVADILANNPEVTDPANVPVGFLVRTAPMETTTTSAVAESVPPTTIVVETVPQTTLPAETVPATTPPETVPPTTTAPTQTTLPNDGVLSVQECEAMNGMKYSFSPNETLMQYFRKAFNMSEVSAYRATQTQRVKDLKLTYIYADDPNDAVDLRECVPRTTDGLL